MVTLERLGTTLHENEPRMPPYRVLALYAGDLSV